MTNSSSNEYQVSSVNDFIYDGWNLIREIASTPTPPYAVTNSYTWGLDLSGSLQGAGGIGGLLSAQLCTNSVVYSYDGNGNVSELISANGTVVGHYEYSPFGETIVATGALADDNSFRFSTKYFVVQLAMGDWGRRWYIFSLGRWASEDPLGEEGSQLISSISNPENPVGLQDGNSGSLWNKDDATILLSFSGEMENIRSLPQLSQRTSRGSVNNQDSARYLFCKNTPNDMVDPFGLDIYIIRGNDSWNPINNMIHRKVCVDIWTSCPKCADCKNTGAKKMGMRCFSYGMIYPFVGIVYEDFYTGGSIVVQQKTTCADDLMIQHNLDAQVGMMGLYSPLDNCVTWSTQELEFENSRLTSKCGP